MLIQQKINLFWFRRDSHLPENRGLFHAIHAQLPLFMFDGNSLDELVDKNDIRNGRFLLLKKGDPKNRFQLLASEYSIENIFTYKHLNG